MVKFTFGNKKNKDIVNGRDLYDEARRLRCLSDESPFAVKESYNTLRTNLLYASNVGGCSTFVVTSANANDGKTINAVNIAISFANMNKKVLLIDADMRNPSVGKYLNVRSKIGLSEILAGIQDEVCVQETSIKNLCLIPAGKNPPNPSELLLSGRFDDVIKTCEGSFDYIIVDTPPINVVADSLTLADKVTGYLIVVRSGVDEKPSVEVAVESLKAVNAKVLGFVLNDVNPKSVGLKSGYGKYGSYGKYASANGGDKKGES